jgi:hypothetical protein
MVERRRRGEKKEYKINEMQARDLIRLHLKYISFLFALFISQ